MFSLSISAFKLARFDFKAKLEVSTSEIFLYLFLVHNLRDLFVFCNSFS